MAWPDFIVAAFALGCIALALSQFEFARRAATFLRQAKAEEKALQLLLRNLSPLQRQQYHAFGYFDVVGSMTKRPYRIYHGTSRNVVEIRDGRPGPGRCFMPKGELAVGDCMLAQKIAIENFEEEVLRTALPF
jgi:hypothetical protein